MRLREPYGNVRGTDSPDAGIMWPCRFAAMIAIAAKQAIPTMLNGLFKGRILGPKKRPGMAPVYYMKANHAKLVDVALVLLYEAAELGIEATQLVLGKAVFFADRSHLNKYGRPVTWDWYLAMPKGPVPMTFYNMMMGDEAIVAKTGQPKWSSTPLAGGMLLFHSPTGEPDVRRVLSPSDVAELKAAMAKIALIGIDEAVKEAHLDPSWKDAIRPREYKAMSLELLFDRSKAIDGTKEATLLSRYSQIYH